MATSIEDESAKTSIRQLMAESERERERRHFAAMAMQGLLAGEQPGIVPSRKSVAIYAVEFATALQNRLDETREKNAG